ncbi:MAG: SPOR domain-containing protein [Pseudomonadota bacterium]
MANSNYEDFDDPSELGPTRAAKVKTAISTVIGAFVALAILLTLGVWFYRLGVRDAQNVPIIRAAAEPAKTRPADPGGVVIPHQDVTSYEVAEASTASAGAAIIAPPPPEPRSEDVAMGELQAQPAVRPSARPADAVSAVPIVAEVEEAPQQERVTALSPEPAAVPQAPQRPAATVETIAETVAETVVETDTETEEPAPETASQTPGPVEEEEPRTIAEQNAGAIAPRASPVAPKRPRNLLGRVETAAQQAQQDVVDLAGRAASSRFQIQLAADPDEITVRQLWKRIRDANTDVLRDRALAVQTTLSGGTTYYRLRVGPFGSRSEAASVCQALKSRGQDCIVARNG